MRDNTPVWTGASQFGPRRKLENSQTSLELLKIAAERAVEDEALSGSVLAELHALAVIAFENDAPRGSSRFRLAALGGAVRSRQLQPPHFGQRP